MNSKASILSDVVRYYSKKLSEFGATARGVDWNSEESQRIRFVELSKIFYHEKEAFSLLDFGCGWGGLLSYLNNECANLKVDYTGFDVVSEMLTSARQVQSSEGRWVGEIEFGKSYDYLVASGVFNVRQQYQDIEWLNYIKSTLEQFDSLSLKGFAFNMLTTYSDINRRRDYLYYADPCYIFDYCKRTFSTSVTLLHDYELYEFTILVKKG